MTIRVVRNAIVDKLRSVADIGVVHEYQRYATSLADLKALYLSTEHESIRGWYVSRAKSRETDRIMTRSVETTTWIINGVLALSDGAASELVADDLVEAIRDAFAADDDLGGAVDQCGVPKPGGSTQETGIQLVDFGPVMFGGVLCHGIKLQLTTIRYLTRNES